MILSSPMRRKPVRAARTAPRTIQSRVIAAFKASGMSKKELIRKVPNLTPSQIVKYLNNRPVYMNEASLEQMIAAFEKVSIGGNP